MKRLTLLRHAKSRWDDPGLEDFNRPLNGRGWSAARRMGEELTHRDFRFDYVLASPAVRVRETIEGIEDKFKFAAPIRFEPRMYLAAEERLITFVRELSASVHRPLLVGHNPGLHSLLLRLIRDDTDRLHGRVTQRFPTAALAVVELPANCWNEVEPRSGRILELILPREL